MAQTPFQTARPLVSTSVAITPLGLLTLQAGTVFDFRTLQAQSSLGKIANSQSIWLDCSDAPRRVRVLNQKTRQYVIYPPGSAGWQPMIISSDATELQILCEAACVVGMAVSSYPFVTSLENSGEINAILDSRRVDVQAVSADVQLLPANIRRAGFSVWNDSEDTLYLLANSGVASQTNFTAILASQAYYETPVNYGGEVRGWWNGVNGGARITEYE